MITSIKTDKLVVISDLHLGNPFSDAKRKVIRFLKWAAREGYDVCINGDGLDIAQSQFSKLAIDVPELFRSITQIRNQGRQVYYVTGNHDIALEHFLEDWGSMKVSPFLNVESGKSRIRVEHGHIYDPFFVKNPELYETLTHFAGYFLKFQPKLYKLWISFERYKSKLRARRTGIVGEHPSFAEAATELSRRGFDAIVFGHTHHPGQQVLENGSLYLNPGSWMMSPHYVKIKNGEVSLVAWELNQV